MTEKPDSIEDAMKIITRLQRRVDRERSARSEAESIADRRMRELWLSNRELDERVGERTQELEMTLAQLEAATTAAAGFFANLSHEMLTPLNGIIGMLELLKDHAHTEATQSYVEGALESSDRLSRLMHRLLDLVEVRAGRMRWQPDRATCAGLAELLREQWNIAALQKQKLLTVSTGTSADTELVIDATRTCQMAGELIDNAIRHGSPGVVAVELHVGPRATSAPDSPAMLHISVTDSGPGFLATGSENLLQVMKELDTSPGRARAGAGVGINLARTFARELGGEVSIDSAPGSPTIAHIWMPASP